MYSGSNVPPTLDYKREGKWLREDRVLGGGRSAVRLGTEDSSQFLPSLNSVGFGRLPLLGGEACALRQRLYCVLCVCGC